MIEHSIKISHKYSIICEDKNGNEKWRDGFTNLVTNEYLHTLIYFLYPAQPVGNVLPLENTVFDDMRQYDNNKNNSYVLVFPFSSGDITATSTYASKGVTEFTDYDWIDINNNPSGPNQRPLMGSSIGGLFGFTATSVGQITNDPAVTLENNSLLRLSITNSGTIKGFAIARVNDPFTTGVKSDSTPSALNTGFSSILVGGGDLASPRVLETGDLLKVIVTCSITSS